MRSRKREDYIYGRAYELAANGAHISPITVVSALIEEGYPEAQEMLDSDLIRADLREVCAAHWGKGGQSGKAQPVAALPPPERVPVDEQEIE